MKLILTVDRRSEKPVPFVEAAKNLVLAVIKAGDGERQVEGFESLTRRIRSWAMFKQAARQWCEKHGERGTGKP